MSLPAQWATARAGPPGKVAGGRQVGERGVSEKEKGDCPPGIGPRRLHASQLRSSQRPSSPGTQLKDTRRTDRPGWHQRVELATRSRLLQPRSYLCVDSFFFALQRYALGLECGLKGTGRKVGPTNDPCAEGDQSTSPLLSDRHGSNWTLRISILCLDAAQGHKNTRAHTERSYYCAVHNKSHKIILIDCYRRARTVLQLKTAYLLGCIPHTTPPPEALFLFSPPGRVGPCGARGKLRRIDAPRDGWYVDPPAPVPYIATKGNPPLSTRTFGA